MEPAAPWPEHVYVLIPSYKSAHTLQSFLPELLHAVPAEAVCVVDDGSIDGTDTVCRAQNVHCIIHPANRGKGAALAAGFGYCLAKNATAVLTLDADGQHSPADLPGFLAAFKANPGCGMIIGKRSMRPGHMPLARIFSNSLTSYFLSCITGIPVLDSQCGYRLYSRTFLESITIQYARFEMESEVIIKAAMLDFPVPFIPVQTLYLKGTSHISHIADTIRWIFAVIRTRATFKQKR